MIRFLLTVTTWALCGPGSAPATAQSLVVGYHAWWMQDAWKDYDLPLYDRIYFFEFAVDAQGGISERNGWPEDWRGMIRAVHAAGGKVSPTVAILDPAVFSSVLGNPGRRDALASTILDLVKSADADGVHLNFEIFEAAHPEARAGFVTLARSLSRSLKAWKPGAELTIFLPGFDWGETYDEAALAEVADYLIIQGYDMHWLTAPTAGPVAPIRGWDGASWEGITARYSALGIASSKLVMAVPYFGYEWPTATQSPGSTTRGEGVPVTYAPVDPDLLPLIRISATARGAAHGVLRDPDSSSPFYRYQGAGGWYQGWFEDAQSLRAKYRFVRQRGLGGVALFLLGYDGGMLEPVLGEEFGR